MENMPARYGLAVTSTVLGVLSLLFILLGLSVPIGALGIITALLSRGNGEMLPASKRGLALCLLGITLGICMFIWSFNALSNTEFSELIQQYQQLYGLSGN